MSSGQEEERPANLEALASLDTEAPEQKQQAELPDLPSDTKVDEDAECKTSKPHYASYEATEKESETGTNSTAEEDEAKARMEVQEKSRKDLMDAIERLEIALDQTAAGRQTEFEQCLSKLASSSANRDKDNEEGQKKSSTNDELVTM